MDSADPMTAIMGTMMAATVATTAMGAMAQKNAGAVAGDTAIANSKLQALEMISSAQMAEREAQSLDFAAQAEREATKFDVARQQEQGTAFKAQQRAEIAGSGLEASGSPLLVLSETAKQIELDKLAIEHAGESRAHEAEDAARLSRWQASELRKGIPLRMELGRFQSRVSRQSGNLAATSTLISGGAKAASIYGSLY